MSEFVVHVNKADRITGLWAGEMGDCKGGGIKAAGQRMREDDLLRLLHKWGQ